MGRNDDSLVDIAEIRAWTAKTKLEHGMGTLTGLTGDFAIKPSDMDKIEVGDRYTLTFEVMVDQAQISSEDTAKISFQGCGAATIRRADSGEQHGS